MKTIVVWNVNITNQRTSKKITFLFNNNAYVLQKNNLHKREDESNVKAKDQISTAHALNFEYVCIYNQCMQNFMIFH